MLYVSGFFADHLERRGASAESDSFRASGLPPTTPRRRRCCGECGGETRRGPDVFDELATNFDELTQVLGDVADALYATSARDPRGVLDLYERWARRGSHTLAEALVRFGVVPTRGRGSVH